MKENDELNITKSYRFFYNFEILADNFKLNKINLSF